MRTAERIMLYSFRPRSEIIKYVRGERKRVFVHLFVGVYVFVGEGD